MNRYIRKELMLGLLIFGLYLTLNQFFALPVFLMGLLLGLSLCLEALGVLPEPLYQNMKQFKANLFHPL